MKRGSERAEAIEASKEAEKAAKMATEVHIDAEAARVEKVAEADAKGIQPNPNRNPNWKAAEALKRNSVKEAAEAASREVTAVLIRCTGA